MKPFDPLHPVDCYNLGALLCVVGELMNESDISFRQALTEKKYLRNRLHELDFGGFGKTRTERALVRALVDLTPEEILAAMNETLPGESVCKRMS